MNEKCPYCNQKMNLDAIVFAINKLKKENKELRELNAKLKGEGNEMEM